MYNKLLIFFFLTVLASSCIDNRAPSGISSIVYYGEGDCMPPVNVADRTFNLYNGKVYVVERSLALAYDENHFDTLKTLSYVTEADNGGFSLLVPPGNYYIMPDTMFYISDDNYVTVHSDELIDREFKFFKCTTF